MKIKSISYTHTYQIGLSQWQKIGLEGELKDGDIYEECFQELKKECDNFHRISNPQLYKNGNEAIVDGYNETRMGEFMQRQDEFDESARKMFGIPPRKPLVINREYERKSIEIENVSSLEELAQFKEYCGKNPDLMTAYTNKLKDLTNKIGKQQREEYPH